MDAIFREALPQDYLEVATWLSDADACLRWAGPQVPYPFVPEELEELLQLENVKSFSLLNENHALCGFCQYWYIAPNARHIGRIIISPQFRAQGLGRVLCQKLIAQTIHDTNPSAITLRVYKNNQNALKLYSSLGFLPLLSESTDELLFMRLSITQKPIKETGQ